MYLGSGHLCRFLFAFTERNDRYGICRWLFHYLKVSMTQTDHITNLERLFCSYLHLVDVGTVTGLAIFDQKLALSVTGNDRMAG